MINNDSNTILDSLLRTASNNWNISQEDIIENMNKIAFHESKGIADAIQKSDKTESGIGPGRGLFQFEIGKDQGAHTAINRLISEYKRRKTDVPDWLSSLAETNYDVSSLSPEQQQSLFLANLLQMPHKKGEKYGKAGFYDTDEDNVFSDDELAHYWAQYHHAGTKPDTDEYDTMIDKFTQDIKHYIKEKKS
jgi:hypothetical protein